MARKKKVQIDNHPRHPRGSEHIEVSDPPTNLRIRDLRLNADGSERVSTEPIVMRVKHRLIGDPDLIREKIRQLRATALDGTEFETFDEADDFDLEDDYGDFTSKWEIPADHDDAVDAYKRFRATGELPADLATMLAKHAPAGPAPSSQDQKASPAAPMSSGTPEPQ